MPSREALLRNIGQAAAAADLFRLRATRQIKSAASDYGIEGAQEKWAENIEASFRGEEWQLAQFFAYSLIMVGRMNPPRCVVAFYNPWVDGLLLTAWKERPADGWKITDFLLYTGETMRGEKAGEGSACPVWLRSDKPVARSVVEACGKTIKVFQERFPIGDAFQFPVLKAAADPKTESAVLSARMRFSLAFFDAKIGASRKVVDESVQKALEVLARGNQDDLRALASQEQDPYVAETLCLLPQQARRSLLPHWYVAQGDKAVVVMSSARFPRWFVLLFLDVAVGSPRSAGPPLRPQPRPIRALGLYDFDVMISADRPAPKAGARP